MQTALAAEPNIRVMTGATCTGLFDDNWLAVVEGNRLHKIRARQVILATGSIEQPLVFRNNDLPGVMNGSAAQRLIRQYGVRPGKRAVIATANADGYAAALDLIGAGVEVAAILDLRQTAPKSHLANAVRDHRVTILEGHTALEAIPEKHNRHVRGVAAAKIVGEGQDGKPS